MWSKCITMVTFSFVLAAAACHKRVPTTTSLPPAPAAILIPIPRPSPAPLPDSVPAPAPSPAAATLDDANRAFNSGNYDEASRGYETYLRSTPPGDLRDQALFQLALTYAMRPAPATDWMRAAATLKQLLDEYPNSPFKSPANLILSLHAELDQLTTDSKQRDQRIKQLTTELDRLKKIDADRRKRP